MLRTLWLATLWLASAAATSPIASRPNHLLGPRFLRFYVADIPPEYSYLRAFDDPYRFPHSPLDHLGPLQHPESVQYSTYNSDYNRGVGCRSLCCNWLLNLHHRIVRFGTRLPRAPCASPPQTTPTLSTCPSFGCCSTRALCNRLWTMHLRTSPCWARNRTWWCLLARAMSTPKTTTRWCVEKATCGGW